jgi:serine protease Do
VRIQTVTDLIAQSLRLYKTSGALVSDVWPRGPAEMGKIHVGDVILTFDGKEVDTVSKLVPIVAETLAGKRIAVEVWRRGRKKKLDLVVGGTESKPVVVARSERRSTASPLPASQWPEVEKDVSVLGLMLSTVTPELRERFNLGDGVEGVVATKIEEALAAGGYQILPGDIIRKVGVEHVPIYWPSQVRKLVDDARGTNRKYFIVLVEREGEPEFFLIKIDKE